MIAFSHHLAQLELWHMMILRFLSETFLEITGQVLHNQTMARHSLLRLEFRFMFKEF